ncbi:MAG: pirin family protein [Candidatus Gracilibacteria bacterium]|nr:pirin family protein [Candidatus Gracilibacteria bacterium]
MKNNIIKSDLVYKANHGWLRSSHIFSFADYYDIENMGFGNMRVFNDDYIAGNSGFGIHPHSNMEILTIILDGEITHGDTLGNKETISVGEIQTMSAGTGINHSEENLSSKETHLFQIWFLPLHIGNKPVYKKFKIYLVKNKLNLLASNNKDDTIGYLDSDVNVYRGIFEKGNSFDYKIEKRRGFFLYLNTGELEIEGEILKAGDQLRFTDGKSYKINCIKASDFVVVDVKI